MEEYIRLEEERAQSRGETFNWQNARFGRMEILLRDEDFTAFDTEFPAIILGSTNAISSQTSQGTTMREYEVEKEDSKIEFPTIFLSDSLTSKTTLSHEPTVSLPCKKNDFLNIFARIDDEDYTNLYVPFGIPFDPKQYYKDGAHANIAVAKSLKPISLINHSKSLLPDMAPLPHYNPRHPWLRYQVEGYTEDIVHDFERRIETIWDRSVNRVHILDFEGLTPEMRHAEGRKSGARLSRGHFIGRLADQFGLVSDEGQRGLTVISRELPVIDLHELAAAAGAHEDDEAGSVVDVGAQDVPGPEQARSPHSLSPGLCHRGLRGSRRRCIMDANGHTITAFPIAPCGSSRYALPEGCLTGTGDASTSAAPHADDQPDP
ncbi:hypothetical protein Tco_1165271 [Tanacetum coccineum]